MSDYHFDAVAELIGSAAALQYKNEIDHAQAHHERMKAFVNERMPNARILLIDNSNRTAEEDAKWNAALPVPLLEALSAAECATPNARSTAQRFAAIFGYSVDDPRFLRWHAPFETPTVALDTVDAIILTGSAAMVTDYDTTPWMQRVGAVLNEAKKLGIPMLGICFGHQIMAKAFGGEVDWMKNSAGETVREMGPVFVEYTKDGTENRLFAGLEEVESGHAGFWVQAVHSQEVVVPPAQAIVLAQNTMCQNQAFAYTDGPMWSIQNHPENNAVFIDIVLEKFSEQTQEWLDALSEEAKKEIGYATAQELRDRNRTHNTHTARERIFANFLQIVAEWVDKKHNS